jgi:hypothetical protein
MSYIFKGDHLNEYCQLVQESTKQGPHSSYSIAFMLSERSLSNLLVQLSIQIYLRTGPLRIIGKITSH